jgi:hypothetical protein
MKWQYLCLVSVLSFALAGVEAVLLRIRLSNGQVIRHEAEGAEGEGKLNINQFRQDMLAKGHIVSLNDAFSFNNAVYNSTDLSEVIQVSDGDLLTIIPSIKPSTNTTTTSSTKGITRQTTTKRGIKTVADIEKHRNSLMKITRQKANSSRSVILSPSTGRILNRISKHGGVALLLGKVNQRQISTTSIGSKFLVNKNKKTVQEYVSSECVEVHAACELCSNSNNDKSFKPSARIEKVALMGVLLSIASDLGLSIVGTAISMGQLSDVMWSPDHVSTVLKLLPYASNTTTFITLSLAADVSSDGSKTPKSSSSKGFKVEAFQFSDQANELCKNGILVADSVGDSSNGNLVALNGTVLIQSTESNSVDCFLLSVPLPILSFESVNPSINEVTYEHYFPTADELKTDQKLSASAMRHLHKNLGNMNSRDIKGILRDVHLLLYLSNIIDKKSLSMLCKSLVDGTATISASIKMTLEMFRQTLAPQNDDEM